jgi:hypothetical protein
MKALTELEIQRAAMVKAARAAIRLKHTLAADRECYERLPEIHDKIDAALQSGEPFELDPSEAFSEDFSA